MFSKKCEYAIRALIFIARKSKQETKAGIKEIARATGAPEQFVAKILHQLVKMGMVRSAKGPAGGFYLDKTLLRNSLADVVIAIDGDRLLTGCGLGLKYCSATRPCPIHDHFKKIRSDILELLQSSKLDALQEQLEDQLVYLKR